MITRRDVLLASAGIPLAAAVKFAPLTTDELRVLAMAATPSSAWHNREDEYNQTRTVHPGTDLYRIVKNLVTRGLVERHETPWRRDMDWYATATPEGIQELHKNGVEVNG